ncbi:FKBP-type peptidyl-prolyl cis-trans isomerase [Phenylobacterium sp.]|uniref:FKBP-type peptidyl-prolyl cis-trans isomerase n=1 Tax=Phenylobacterium sp. TaxID=1871053 RepID=UPI0012195056|nr:FKBP-type peptidyl-prolyl cis-trans isomerase [Phenylobacterium sp.]THD64737.1 MAG: FKBP-type peptidyl-prolyl cis-trans isomerase [Phenylobacterium sp.]
MTGPVALAALTLLAAAAAALPASAMAVPGEAAGDQSGVTVSLPGLRYQVLASGPATGEHPKRGDSVQMRYVGRLEGGEVFSTSPDDGKGVSTFGVNQVIPGMSAALQLMRVGDHWRITMPPYLAYGPGRPFNTPAPAGAAGQAIQKRGIPPDATLIFDVDLVAIVPPKAP